MHLNQAIAIVNRVLITVADRYEDHLLICFHNFLRDANEGDLPICRRSQCHCEFIESHGPIALTPAW